jgi:glutathione S-transferase
LVEPPCFLQEKQQQEGPMQLTLHEYAASGNCYKVRLTAAHLGLPLERREYDILNGETRTPEFLSRVNANGRIPVLQVDDRFIPESNAACFYLADGSDLIPEDRFDKADMLRWMFFEQYNHEPNVATLRFWLAFVGENRLSEAQRALLPGKRQAGEAALKLMDEHLAARDFLVADRFTLADIALYAYTHVAEEGSFDLSAYPAVQRWMERVAQLPRHVPMDAS